MRRRFGEKGRDMRESLRKRRKEIYLLRYFKQEQDKAFPMKGEGSEGVFEKIGNKIGGIS